MRLKSGLMVNEIAVLGNGIEAARSVPTAIYCLLKQPNFYNDCVICAISLSGDTYTIAAITGAISGACLGIKPIPSERRAKLENKEYIEGLAQGL